MARSSVKQAGSHLREGRRVPGTLVGRILARARRYAPGVRARLAASRRAVLGWVISAPAVWPARAKGAIQRTLTLARRAVGALAHTARAAPLVARASLPQGRSLVADYLPIVIAQIAAALIVVAEITRDAGRDAPDVAR